MNSWRAFALMPAALVAPQFAFAETYLSVEQAQRIIFPGIEFQQATMRLTEDQRRTIEKRSGVRVRALDLNVWRAIDGSIFIVDQVLGKHEFITYALGIDPRGAVKGIEVMEYKESYGYEIRRPEWRNQFSGKNAAAPLQLDGDIRNISGATLSSKHVTEGIRRLLATHDLALR